jgi:outer membrane biosynthesis protein TonB
VIFCSFHYFFESFNFFVGSDSQKKRAMTKEENMKRLFAILDKNILEMANSESSPTKNQEANDIERDCQAVVDVQPQKAKPGKRRLLPLPDENLCVNQLETPPKKPKATLKSKVVSKKPKTPSKTVKAPEKRQATSTKSVISSKKVENLSVAAGNSSKPQASYMMTRSRTRMLSIDQAAMPSK